MTTSKFIPLEPKDIVRFMSYVQVDNDSGAWLWLGGKTASGYGAFWLSGSTVSAHRVSWTIKHGDIPPGLFVCHKHEHLGRHNVNPDHLFLGTPLDNTRDMERKGRSVHPKGEKNGRALLDSEMVLRIRSEYSKGGITHRQLSEKLGVPLRSISQITEHRNWRHLSTKEELDNLQRLRDAGHLCAGERNNKAKLTAQQVSSLREEFILGAKKAHLAKKYNLTPTAVHFIISRRTWRHLP